jgi:ABC-type dipeptide/oligopeptide/nickel transport system ATPase component
MYIGNSLRDALEDSNHSQQRRTRRPPPSATSGRAEPRLPRELGSLLEVQNLSIAYPQEDGSTHEVVHDVSFHVRAGETLGIVGESGSGKSQLAFSILGLLPQSAERTSGGIFFDGQLYGAVAGTGAGPRYGRDLAYIPQEPMSNLDPTFTIGHQLVRPLVKVMGISKKDARQRAIELLTRVGIRDPERTMASYPHEISGGMAQRVLIAGAVSCNPRVLIADEPTTALDVTVQAEVLDLLRELQSELGMALVLVTHNFGVVADLCQRVLVMQAGVAVEEGNARDVLRAPQHEYSRLLLAAMLEGKEPMTPLLTPGGLPS